MTPSPEAVKRTLPERGPKGPGTRFARAKAGGAAADTRPAAAARTSALETSVECIFKSEISQGRR